MEKLKFNLNNKKYYSNEFIKGFECGVERQFNIDMTESLANQKTLKEELEKIKKELHKLAFDDDGEYIGVIDNDNAMNLIDNYISELKRRDK